VGVVLELLGEIDTLGKMIDRVLDAIRIAPR
jgi:hypothetical protein